MTGTKVRVTRTDDGETLLERRLSTSEYLALLKDTYASLETGRPSEAEGESGNAYDVVMEAEL